MECRANSSEKLPLMLHADNDDQGPESLLPALPEEVLVIILHQLPLRTIANLARTSKTMNARVSDARSIYTNQREGDSIPTHLSYRQVIDTLKNREAAKKRIAAIHDSYDTSCYYIQPEDRACTQAAEGVAIIVGGLIALMSGSVSLIMSLSSPCLLPQIVCGTGSAVAACPIGLGMTSRLYTNRFDREDKEVAELNQWLKDTEALASQIRRKTSGN